MRYAIYGANRVAKDFLYLFEDVKAVVCFADTDEDADAFTAGTRIVCRPASEIAAMRDAFDELIVCDFPGVTKAAKAERLASLGWVRGREYHFEEDFFDQFDSVKPEISGKKLYVWGCGKRGERFYQWNVSQAQPLAVEAYLDARPLENFHGHAVLQKDEFFSHWDKKGFILVTFYGGQVAQKALETMGLRRLRDFCLLDDLLVIPSLMMRQTIFQREVYDFSCESMLNHAEVSDHGHVVCCCQTFLFNGIGEMDETHDFQSVWKGILHRIMCLSNMNRTFTFCNKELCPLFIDRTMSTSYDLGKPYHPMDETARTVAIGIDYTCNLKCITCRDHFKIAKGEEEKRCLREAERICKEVLPGCEFLIMSGSCEVLLSSACRAIYTHPVMKHLKYFRLLTNGTLFTPQKWKEIREHTDAKIMMTVSIDAATKETYEKIRRGGNFDVLQENMRFAAGLRKSGELAYLRFNFVVQQENLQEMIPFTKWGKELGIDEVFFTKIRNWGTYTPEEFKERITVMEEDGVTAKPELQAVIDDPVMQDKIVDLGTIHYHHDVSDVTDIQNYYRWELERKVPGLFA